MMKMTETTKIFVKNNNSNEQSLEQKKLDKEYYLSLLEVQRFNKKGFDKLTGDIKKNFGKIIESLVNSNYYDAITIIYNLSGVIKNISDPELK